MRSTGRIWALRILSMILGGIIAFALLEVGSRIVYSDAGTGTCRAPGGESVRYARPESSPSGMRMGAQEDRLEQVVILGDSITWGVCISNWSDVYPKVLLDRLNQDRRRYGMNVFAEPGREITHHIGVLDEVEHLEPDVLIYQWYVNDMERDKGGRPHPHRAWRSLPFHRWLAEHSYAWALIDRMLELLPTREPSYVDYINERFAPGTLDWARFQMDFLRWAHRATAIAERVVVFFYPTLPYAGMGSQEYFFAGIHERIRKLPRKPIVRLPAAAMRRVRGENVSLPGATFENARAGIAGTTPRSWIVFGPYVQLVSGRYTVTFRLRTPQRTEDPIAAIEVTADRGRVLERRRLNGTDFPAPNEWTAFRLPFEAGPEGLHDVEFRVEYLGGATVAVDRIDVRYPPLEPMIEFLDMTPHVKDLRTHASFFDAHPNEATHRRMAELLQEHIVGREARG